MNMASPKGNENLSAGENIELNRNVKIDKNENLWSINFFLLWQGQLVSAMGDVIYEIALGFWVLAVTGSTALMGTLMAATIAPRVIIAPFAGVFVDRNDRKKIIVFMDLIRGIVITLVGIAAIFGFIEIWMVFTAGVILGICAAFFNPSIGSSLPDIVPKSKLIKANSALSMVYTGTNIVANPIGGILYNVIGAPIMFLVNGISYLFSSFTEIFLKIPKIHKRTEQSDFMEDLKDGFKFVWNFKGLKYLITCAAVLNFFANMAIVLFLPLFQQTQGLGAKKYGFAVATMTGGMFLGMIFTSLVNIPYSKRLVIFITSGIIFSISFALVPMVSYKIMLPLLLIAGFFNAIVNVFIQSSNQLTVPQEMRGKVFSLSVTVLQALTPIGMAVGGILAEFISIKYIIFTCFIVSAFVMIPLMLNKPFRLFINYNPDTQTLEDIM